MSRPLWPHTAALGAVHWDAEGCDGRARLVTIELTQSGAVSRMVRVPNTYTRALQRKSNRGEYLALYAL